MQSTPLGGVGVADRSRRLTQQRTGGRRDFPCPAGCLCALGRRVCWGGMILGMVLRVGQYLCEQSAAAGRGVPGGTTSAGRGLGELAEAAGLRPGGAGGRSCGRRSCRRCLRAERSGRCGCSRWCAGARRCEFATLARRSPAAGGGGGRGRAVRVPRPADLLLGGGEDEYSTDVSAAVALFWVAERCRGACPSAGGWWRTRCVGAVAIWFSHAAIFVVAGVGAALALVAVGARGTGPGWGGWWRRARCRRGACRCCIPCRCGTCADPEFSPGLLGVGVPTVPAARVGGREADAATIQ